MRIVMCRFDEVAREFSLQIEAEGQEERSMLVELDNRVKAPVRTFGMTMGKSATLLWLHIPLKAYRPHICASFSTQRDSAKLKASTKKRKV